MSLTSMDNTITDSTKIPRLITESEDRLSQLPDCLLHHIFKFLPIITIVQTCVLSKRWKTLWTSCQYLNFCYRVWEINLARFVDSLLMHREPLDVNTFRLVLTEACIRYTSEWVVYAIKHNVRVLLLDLNWYTWHAMLELPDCLFTCQSLEELYIAYADFPIDFPRSTSLKSLKTLYLYDLVFFDEDLHNIISGCPILESLRLESCEIGGSTVSNLDICSHTVKYLTIEYGFIEGVRFCTPNLLSLHYESSFKPVVSFADMPYLDCATIFHVVAPDLHGDTGDVQYIEAFGIIMAAANTKTLKLCGPWIELFFMNFAAHVGSELPTFKNLKTLVVEKVCMKNLEAVARFMLHAPNLEKLVIVQIMDYGGKRDCDTSCPCQRSSSNPPEYSFNCPNLKTVEFKCWENRFHISDLIKTLQKCFIPSPGTERIMSGLSFDRIMADNVRTEHMHDMRNLHMLAQSFIKRRFE